jgi:hypothetical protein
MRTTTWIATMVIVGGGIAFLAAESSRESAADTSAAAPNPPARLQPVDESTHEFMEYFFQPTYKRLKAAMAKAPAGGAGWKTVKADSLVLAEGGNLLLMRTPPKGGADWNKRAIEVRTRGGQLYRAAKKRDHKSAQTHYRAMLTSCNACHKAFAKGKHQLKP